MSQFGSYYGKATVVGAQDAYVYQAIAGSHTNWYIQAVVNLSASMVSYIDANVGAYSASLVAAYDSIGTKLGSYYMGNNGSGAQWFFYNDVDSTQYPMWSKVSAPTMFTTGPGTSHQFDFRVNTAGGAFQLWIDNTFWSNIFPGLAGDVAELRIGQIASDHVVDPVNVDDELNVLRAQIGSSFNASDYFFDDFRAGPYGSAAAWTSVTAGSSTFSFEAAYDYSDPVPRHSMLASIGASSGSDYGRMTFTVDFTVASARAVVFISAASAATILAASAQTNYIVALTTNGGALLGGVYLKTVGGVLHWIMTDATATDTDLGDATDYMNSWLNITIDKNNSSTGAVTIIKDSVTQFSATGKNFDGTNLRHVSFGQYGSIGTAINFTVEVHAALLVGTNPFVQVKSTTLAAGVLTEFSSTFSDAGNTLTVIDPTDVDPSAVVQSITDVCYGGPPPDNGVNVAYTQLDPNYPTHIYTVRSLDFVDNWCGNLFWLYGGYYGDPSGTVCECLPNSQAEVDWSFPDEYAEMYVLVSEQSALPVTFNAVDREIYSFGPLTWNPGTETYSGPTIDPVITLSASLVTQTSMQLNGSVNPEGVASTAYFEWGTSTSYGNSTTPQSVGAGNSPVIVDDTITGLQAGTLYFFRAVRNP